jgi:hypothetical protein
VQPSGSFSFWQLNHESPVSAMTAVFSVSIPCRERIVTSDYKETQSKLPMI